MEKQKIKRIIVVLAFLLVLGGLSRFSDTRPGELQVEAEYDPQERLENIRDEKQEELKFYEGSYAMDSIVLSDTSKAQAEQIAEKLGATLRMTADETYGVLYLPEGVSVADAYAMEESLNWLEKMELDYYVKTSGMDALGNELFTSRPNYTVDDTSYENQNYLDYINMQDVWKISKGAGTTVAVIDTGIDTDHPEFVGKISEYSYNASEDKVVKDYGIEVVEDEEGHGTAVAGVISAAMNNGVGITGIAPEAELLVIKCECDANGQFVRGSDLVFGLAYAIEKDVDVVNMSFSTSTNIFDRYTELAADSDIICVAAAGNEGCSLETYPAADENVIGVGALDTQDWSLAVYSNFGDNSDVLAPGTVYTTTLGGEYKYVTGTSLSSPIVAASVALYLSQNPYQEYTDICELLKASCIDLGTPGEDWYYSYGTLDLYAFLCEEKGTITYEMLTDEVKNSTQIFVKGHAVQYMPEPERENVVFDGWYYDMELMDECEYYTESFTNDVTLYAGWINEDEGTPYIYTTLDDGTIEIQSYTGKRRHLTVPSVIEGKTVSSIGYSAFKNNSRLRSVELPATITNIGDYAFYQCIGLLSIDIPENVKTIGNSAFENCGRMRSVGIAQNGALKRIGNFAFAKSGITSFAIPANLTELGSGAFYGSSAMRQITVAEGNDFYKIVNKALYDAPGANLIYYPAGLTGEYAVADGTKNIGDYAFAYTRKSSVALPEGLERIGKKGFEFSYLQNITIPASVSTMEENAFYYSSNLFSVVFAEGNQLRLIPKEGFSSCSALTGITVPTSVQKIDECAFADSGLKRITFAENSQLTVIENGAFSGCPLENLTVPDRVETISGYSFSGCIQLTQVTFGKNSACKSIGRKAFRFCNALGSIVFPDSLTEVGEQAFFESGLTEVSIGAGLVNIGDGAFSGCKKLSAFTVSENNSVYEAVNGVLFNKDKTELKMYPCAKEGTYTLPESVTLIRSYAFTGADKLTKVILNEGLLELGEYAFSRCDALETPVLPSTLVTIGANAFEYCPSMTDTLLIPKKVISIGRFAFYYDYNLKNIQIEAESEMSRLGYGAFGYCGIEDFTVPGNVSAMGQEVFTGCRNLIAVTFEADSKLTNLAAWIFSGADELRQITFEEGNSLANVEARALEGLRKLQKIDLSACLNLTKIGNYAFNNCSALSAFVIPENVTEVGRYAFFGCQGLSKITIPEKTEFIGRYAFAGTNNINVYFKNSLLPAYLEENWDYGIAGYYMAVSEIHTSGDWTYALTNDGKASVIAYNGSATELELTTIDGYEVVSIGGGAFKNNTTLQKITLPDTLTGIYNSAFKGTTALTSITIPAKVSVIDTEAFRGSGISSVIFEENSQLQNLGRYAFAETANLMSVTIPTAVTDIRAYAFYESGLQEISFSEKTNLKEIGRFAFAKSGLKSIILPDTVTKVDYYAFSENSNLAEVSFGNAENLQIFGNAFYQSGLNSVAIPENVTYLGDLCFASCKRLTEINVAEENKNYSSVEGVLFNKAKTKLITCPAGKTGSYEVADSVMALAFAAFEGSSISEVIFTENSQLMTLGYRAFYDCDSLTAINIPDSVQSIENYTFAYCDNLETVTVTENSQLGGIYKSAFYNCAKLSEFLIPDGVQEISDCAFYGCSAMSDVQLSENSQLKGIYDHAFEHAGITSFIMPEGMLELGDYAFNGAKLETVTFNEVLTYVGEYALADCGLAQTTALSIPETVEWIGNGALKGVTALEELTIPFLGNYLGDEEGKFYTLFSESAGNVGTSPTPELLHTVHLVQGDFISDCAFQFCSFIKVVTMPETVSRIGAGAFEYTGLVSVKIPENVKVIERMMFAGCYQLENVELPDKLMKIEYAAFHQCRKLASVELPETLSKIEDQVFYDTALKAIRIPGELAVIGDNVFGSKELQMIEISEENKYFIVKDGILFDKDYTKVYVAERDIAGNIILPDTCQEIAGMAFAYCKNMQNAELPNGLKSIGAEAFAECKSLENITIPESVVKIGVNAFSYSGLKNAIVNARVERLDWTFTNTPLESVILSEGIKILHYTFWRCNKLKNVELPETLVELNNSTFEGCTSLESIYLPKNVSTIKNKVFSGCTNMKAVIVDKDNPYFATKDGLLYDKQFTNLYYVPTSVSGIVTVPDGIIALSNGAFYECHQLEKVILPETLTSIGDECFYNCGRLADVQLGSNIKYIGTEAFTGTAMWFDAENWSRGLINGTNSGVFYVNKYAVEAWNVGEELIIREGTKVIAKYFVKGQKEEVFKKVSLPDSVQYINDGAFFDCINLEAVYTGEGLKEIGKYAFEGCSKLESVRLSEGIEKIDAASFTACSALNYFYGGSCFDWIEDDLLLDGKALQTVVLPGTSYSILDSADKTRIDNLIISTTEPVTENYLTRFNGSDTRVFCYVDRETNTWPSGWNNDLETYYAGEWNLATFYVDDIIVKMDPVLSAELVQAPAENLIAEYLPTGATFAGWDINGDGQADTVPATLTEELEAHAILDIPVSSIAISEAEELEVGYTTKLEVSYEPYGYNHSDEVIWSSSNESIATVAADGTVTAVAEGTATITATLKENAEVTATCTVSVIPVQYGIKLEKTKGTVNVGEKITIPAVFVLPDEDVEETVWESTDETIATVEDGVVTGVTLGSIDVTITHGGYTNTYGVDVLAPLTGVSLKEAEGTLNVGETKEMAVAYTPAYTTDDKGVIWYSDKSSVARVNSDGLVTAVGPGTATIHGLIGDFEVTYTVTVKAPIQWIKLNTTTGTLRLERTKQLEVIYEPSNTTDDKTAIWTTSDETVATVDENGLVTAVKAGTAVITATVGEHEATYTVTVIGIKDEKTGIIVTNSDDTPMDENISLDAEAIDSETAKEKYKLWWEWLLELLRRIYAEAIEKGHKEMTHVFDINMLQNNVHIQPDKTVDVEIPLPDGCKVEDAVVYRLEEDGTLTHMKVEYKDGKFRFKTEHFSVYVLGTKSEQIYVTDITAPERLKLCPGKTVNLETTVTPADAADKTLTYKSSNKAVATVDENGKVTAVAEGTANITIASKDGDVSVECKIDVGHTWDDGNVIKDPTTAEEGKISYHCKDCGEEKIEKSDKLPAEIAPGDANGDGKVSAEDALAILKDVANMEKVPDEYVTFADVDKNGTLSAEDALMVLKRVANMIVLS